jgi:hypothetical protein
MRPTTVNGELLVRSGERRSGGNGRRWSTQ